LSSGEAKKLSVIGTFDLFAVRTSESEQIFDQCCTKSDVDIISLNLGDRMNYFLNKTLIKQALQRGITFEICYGSGSFEGSQANRKGFLMNAMSLIKVSKGQGIILSCDSDRKIY
jgi:ribonuclease P/MRP protein subunit RPP1